MSAFFNFVSSFFSAIFDLIKKYLNLEMIEIGRSRIRGALNALLVISLIPVTFTFVLGLFKSISFVKNTIVDIFVFFNNIDTITSVDGFPAGQVFLSTMILQSFEEVFNMFFPILITLSYIHIILFLIKKYKEFINYCSSLLFVNPEKNLKNFLKFIFKNRI